MQSGALKVEHKYALCEYWGTIVQSTQILRQGLLKTKINVLCNLLTFNWVFLNQRSVTGNEGLRLQNCQQLMVLQFPCYGTVNVYI